MKKKSKRKLPVSSNSSNSSSSSTSDKSSTKPSRGRPKKPDVMSNVLSVLTTMSDTLTGILLEIQKLNGARPYWDPINPYVPTTFGPIPPLPQDSEPYKVVTPDNLTPIKKWSVAEELSKMVEQLQPEIKDILNRIDNKEK